MENLETEKVVQRYTPVEVQDSPAKKQKGNLTGTPRIVHDSSADLYNHIQEWNGAHLTGVSVINEICNGKIIHLNSTNVTSVYPPGLEELCNHLQDVCNKLIAVVHNIKEVKNHLEGLMKLNEMKNIVSPVFTTWQIQEYVELSTKIYDMYAKELKMKHYIKENIGHAKYEENVLLYQTIWVQQPYIENLDLLIEAMLKETSLRQ
uniref:Putative cyclin-dependent kinase 2-interacting protein n=1 Tax=Panstrongylus lignarius TaxID=156445 RepID=A0A224XKI6_9HEMI